MEARTLNLPDGITAILEKIEEAGETACLVGGCVRDLLMGNTPYDYDMASSAAPEKIREIFGEEACSGMGEAFGTVCVSWMGRTVEITAFRKETAYSDSRHPEGVTYVQNLREDLQRRDFTCNAIAYSLQDGIVDPFGGEADIRAGILRCVGIPAVRFQEDALRILRGLRFQSKCGLTAEAATAEALHSEKENLRHISGERFLTELTGILMGENAAAVLMEYGDVLAVQLPEILPCIGFEQHTSFHDFTVWEHTARAVGAASPIPEVRLSMLLHDIEKPSCFQYYGGSGHFPGHAERSAETADRCLRRLHCGAEMRDLCVKLIFHHRRVPETLPEARRMQEIFGKDVSLYAEVLKADDLSKKVAALQLSELVQQYLLLAKEAETLCCSLGQLAVRGDDLAAAGYCGREIGTGLRMLLDAVMEEQCVNEKDALLAYLADGMEKKA